MILQPPTTDESLIRRDKSDILIGQSSDTRSQFWYTFDNFQLFTSTPKMNAESSVTKNTRFGILSWMQHES